ncbi:hypothetical protein AGMMS4957_02830 [Bacteroidia bacterium]|nr:hypothetical protein AGMMS4957_02830 [Bacteroidia bacterium]
MKVNYTKVCTLPQDLIPLLQSRGLLISDEQQAIGYLTSIGYFRLSAYCYPLLKEPKTEHLYKIGSSFDSVMNMYRFDRKLRILLFNEIEKIEVAIRSAINNWLSYELNDVFWMNNPDNFHDMANFSKTSTIIQSDKKRIYYRICIIKYLLFSVSPHNTFAEKLKSLLVEYPTVDERAMGFPADWENEPLWKSQNEYQSQ